MNSSSKTPPRFVPTLTEIVPVEVAKEEAGEDGSSSMRAHVPDAAADSLAIAAAPLAPFHSPWLADGLYVRGLPAAIPHDLPPLPESLPPQQPFADPSVEFQDSPVQGVEPLLEQREPESVQGESIGDQALDTADLVVEAEAATEQVDVQQGLDMQEQMLNQLMQHVEQVLDERLQAMIAAVVQEQTQSLAQRLREEMKSVLRQTLEQAVGTATASHKA